MPPSTLFNGPGADAGPPLEVFISYHWDNQDEVLLLRSSLDQAGISCWMDVGQIGGGDFLYNQIYKGIHSCQVNNRKALENLAGR